MINFWSRSINGQNLNRKINRADELMLIFKKNFQKTMCLIGNFSKFLESKKFSPLLKKICKNKCNVFLCNKSDKFFWFLKKQKDQQQLFLYVILKDSNLELITIIVVEN